jgi:signal transduction histidine kinase
VVRSAGRAEERESGAQVNLLTDVLLVTFLALTLAAALHWRRRRTAPAPYVTAAFGIITVVLLTGRLRPEDATGVWDTVALLNVVLLALFPWLLAAFAWSFEGRLPRWLRWASGVVVAIAAWGTTLVPFPDPGERDLVHELFLLVFIGSWGVLLVAAAVRLWTAGGRQQLVRARMRLMGGGMVALTLALFVAIGGGDTGDLETIQLISRSFLLLAAVLFIAGFAPPLPLRLWWRRRATHQFQRMQVALIGASTPREVGRAVVPLLADLLGSAVVLVGNDGQVLASSQLPDEQANALARRLSAGGTVDDDTLVVPVEGSWLLVRHNPYTPVFGQDEQELVEAFSLQLRLAMERSQLFEAHLAARTEAERASQELEAMLLGLSHDLRSPAIAISGFASLLSEVDDPESRAEMIGRIQASTTYLNELVDALLELSRIGRAQTDVEPVDLEEVAALVGQRLAANHPGVTVTVEGRLPVVRLNPARTEQLLDNLVGNAVKHGGREDLTVTLRAWPTADGVDVAVADDGRGVPEGDRELVFALFQRGTNAGGRGSGLGLGMVRRIAESAGGSVQLAPSEEGATFVVSLPADVVVDPRTPAPVPS